MTPDPLSAEGLRAAWRRLDGQVAPASILQPPGLGRAVGQDIEVRLLSDTAQHSGSFKFRGALCHAQHHDAQHLVTASSGNFGAALAAACALTAKACTVVMPRDASAFKRDNVRRHGARIVDVDTARMSRWDRVRELTDAEPGLSVVSPYDDPWVVAGNASLGDQLFRIMHVDDVLVPVGGGGLASGIIVARDLHGAQAGVYGVEPERSGKLRSSLDTGAVVTLESEPDTLADGARTLALGALNFRILREGLTGTFAVGEAELRRAIRTMWNVAKLKVEPTAALALAALMSNAGRFAGRRVACVVSGGNVDASVIERLVTG